MSLGRRVGRAEAVIFPVAVRDVPCAFHALADITPTPAGAVVWEGGCLECGEPLAYHETGSIPAREREVYRELYSVGVTLDTITGSRRLLAALAWVWRPRLCAPPAPLGAHERALLDEHTRRMVEKWAAHWERASGETLEAAAKILDDGLSVAELEAIIWPES